MLFAGRAIRRFGLDQNPLRRPIDRLETWIMIVLVLALVLATPGAAWRTGRAAYAAGVNSEIRERASRVPTEAVVIADSGTRSVAETHSDHAVFPARAVSGTARVRATVRWTTADGVSHTGPVMVGARSRPGDRVQVWTDGRGNLADPPQQRIQTTVDATAVAALSATGVISLVALLRLIVRRTLDARRMAQWEAAWWRFEPRWTGRS
jgi:hypothetical protein